MCVLAVPSNEILIMLAFTIQNAFADVSANVSASLIAIKSLWTASVALIWDYIAIAPLIH